MTATMRNTRRIVSSALTVVASLLVLSPAPSSAQTIEYYHLDALGSVRAVTDQSGAVIERHDLLPFGEEVSPPGGPNPRLFTGKERDTETGLDYFGARYYSGKRARFTTVDPVYTWQENLVDPQRWNRYSYVRNNPMRYTDPDGRAIETGWDALNVAIGFGSFVSNVVSGNWGAAALDVAGTIYDVGATAIPGLPGGASFAIRSARAAAKADDVAKAIVKYDPAFAAQQILGEAPVTAGGRSITPHAADRMVNAGPGRRPMSKAEVDQVLDKGDRIRKVDMNHPAGPTVTVQNTTMPGKPQVVVDAQSGKRVVTVIQPK